MTEVSGETLYNDLSAAASRKGESLSRFAAPLFNGQSWKIEQLRIARRPTKSTIERVRSLIAGEPLPETARVGNYARDSRGLGLSRADAEAANIPRGARSVGETLTLQAEAKARISWLRDVGELAHATRRPGQTVADRARELRSESAEAIDQSKGGW